MFTVLQAQGSELVAELALTFPQHTVRLVGACVPSVRERLAGITNIELVGEVHYRRLPAYVRSFWCGQGWGGTLLKLSEKNWLWCLPWKL